MVCHQGDRCVGLALDQPVQRCPMLRYGAFGGMRPSVESKDQRTASLRPSLRRLPLLSANPPSLANGSRFRILNIVDDMTKQCLGAIPDTSIPGRRVARQCTNARILRSSTKQSDKISASRISSLLRAPALIASND